MTTDKGNDRLNEVMGGRSADGLTEGEAGTLNSASMGQRCRYCQGYGYGYSPIPVPHCCICGACNGTGREATFVAERRPIAEFRPPSPLLAKVEPGTTG